MKRLAARVAPENQHPNWPAAFIFNLGTYVMGANVMASLWIKIEHVTPDKPEVAEIADMLSLTLDDIVGKLLRVFIWVDTQMTEESNAVGVSKLLVDRSAGVVGFADALVNERVGWLNVNANGSVSFVNFDYHNGKNAKTRALAARRSADHKAREAERKAAAEREAERKSNDASVTSALPYRDEDEYRDEDTNTNTDASASLSSGDDQSTKSNPTVKDSLTDEASQVLDAWKAMAKRCGRPVFRSVHNSRKIAIMARLREPDGLAHLMEAIGRVENSSHLRADDGAWPGATIDWILKPANLAKILEGNYDDRNGNGQTERILSGAEQGAKLYARMQAADEAKRLQNGDE